MLLYCAIVFTACLFAQTGVLVFAQKPSEVRESERCLYVDLDAKTWKTRGRIFYDIEGSLYRKFTNSGFKIIRQKENFHAMTLSVRYHDEKGPAYGVNDFGTVLNANFRLLDRSSNVLWELEISAVSENSISGTPPYLDVLRKFVTNPYYFFIGELLKSFLDQGFDIHQALPVLIGQISSQRSFSSAESRLKNRSNRFAHAMDSEGKIYLLFAVTRSIGELVICEDPRTIPVLLQLSQYPNDEVRNRANEAFKALEGL